MDVKLKDEYCNLYQGWIGIYIKKTAQEILDLVESGIDKDEAIRRVCYKWKAAYKIWFKETERIVSEILQERSNYAI